VTAPVRPRRGNRRPQRATPVGPPPNTGTARAVDPDADMARDPFLRRIADPKSAERTRLSRLDILEGMRALEAQREKAVEADAMYDGEIGMVYASQQVRKLLARQGVDEAEIEDLNYAKIPVDTVANRLQIAAVKVAPKVSEEDAEESDDGDEQGTRGSDEASADEKAVKRAERAVKALRRANRLDVYEKALHKNVSKHGDAFLFVWPVLNDSGKIISVDMRVNSAHNVVFVYDEEDPLQVAYVLKSWETASDIDDETGDGRRLVTRVNLYYPGPREVDQDGEITQGAGRVERWVTQAGAPAGRADSWVRVHSPEMRATIDADDLEEVAADEFGDPDEPLDADDIPSPFGLTWFHFRNDVPGGIPEHRAAYGPQKLINKLIWSYAGVIEHMGWPQRYQLIDPKMDDAHVNLVDPDHPEDEDDDPEGGGTSGLSSEPGVIWKLYGKSTGQYSAADPDTFMKPLDRFITSMSELTGLPRYSFTKATADLPSGEAARELNGERDALVQDRQDRYDPDWQDAYELALRMLGIDGVAVDIRWVPVTAVNDMNGLNVLKAKAELGVPSEVLLNEAGYPDELIAQWLKSQEGLSLEQRIALLGQLATAAQGMAPGVTAGIVSDNQTAALLARIVGLLAVGTSDSKVTGPDALPDPTFREPPPTNPALAAVEAQAKAAEVDPMRKAQVKQAEIGAKAAEVGVEASRAGVEQTKASTEATRTGTKMMLTGQPEKKAGDRR
jgi:hypothetical protein